MSIVDSHVHFWDPRRLRYPWLDDTPALNHAFLPEDFADACEGVEVTKALFVECGRESSQALKEVDWVSSLVANRPRIRGIVAHASLERGEQARGEVERLRQRPLVKGIRRLLQGEADTDFCLRPEFIAGVRLLAEFGLPFDLCIRSLQLRAATAMVRRVPEVTFVLDHFGKPPVREGETEPWASELRELAKLPNVSCKISGLATEADLKNWRTSDLRPCFEIALEAFGFDRVLFGGDWPACTLATSYCRWVAAVDELVGFADRTDREKLFQTNAEKLYRI